jgi:hypothetical protein
MIVEQVAETRKMMNQVTIKSPPGELFVCLIVSNSESFDFLFFLRQEYKTFFFLQNLEPNEIFV